VSLIAFSFSRLMIFCESSRPWSPSSHYFLKTLSPRYGHLFPLVGFALFFFSFSCTVTPFAPPFLWEEWYPHFFLALTNLRGALNFSPCGSSSSVSTAFVPVFLSLNSGRSHPRLTFSQIFFFLHSVILTLSFFFRLPPFPLSCACSVLISHSNSHSPLFLSFLVQPFSSAFPSVLYPSSLFFGHFHFSPPILIIPGSTADFSQTMRRNVFFFFFLCFSQAVVVF